VIAAMVAIEMARTARQERTGRRVTKLRPAAAVECKRMG
jgi:hypothetical protein